MPAQTSHLYIRIIPSSPAVSTSLPFGLNDAALSGCV